MKREKITSYVRNSLIGLAIFSAGIMTGDSLDLNRKFLQPLRYFKQPVAKNCPRDYWNYTTKVKKENGQIRLYFGNETTNEFHKVRENGLVGNLYDNITYFLEEVSEETGFNDLKDTITEKVNELKKEEE